MSYATVAVMAADEQLLGRVTACAAQEQTGEPVWWMQKYCWNVVSAPGWDAAWESATASYLPNIGLNEGVITDGMILASVQSVLSDLQPA